MVAELELALVREALQTRLLVELMSNAMHKELVQSGRMTNRQFHDAILQGGRMPVEIVRARIENLPLTRDYRTQWQFDDGR